MNTNSYNLEFSRVFKIKILKLTAGIILIFLVTNFCSLDESTSPEPSKKEIKINLVDSTDVAGLTKYTLTFGAAVVDINKDGTDDLVISNHGQIPSLYLNKNGVFEDHSYLLPEQRIKDRHGITAVDLDNDGDRDLVIAGGGSDGIGKGHTNSLYQNCLQETGTLAFTDISIDTGIGYPSWRSRHFLPLPNKDGSLIDLYLVCLSRENCPDLYFANRTRSEIRFAVDETIGLNQSFHSKGKDIFFDYDRDGDQDLLVISRWKPEIYERTANHYERKDLILGSISHVYCVGVGDLNNDGYMDLYFGREANPSGGDNISFNDKEIHFFVLKQQNDPSERISFYIKGKSIDINFIYRIPGKTVNDPSNIFVGQSKQNPPSRRTTISAESAQGEPVLDSPGIYIWKEPGIKRWHIEWIYGKDDREDKGKIVADSLTNVEKEGFETCHVPETRDKIFINKKGEVFEEFGNFECIHNHNTRSVTICDLNNDGLLDIVGIRGSETGRYNGEPFALINYGHLDFEFRNIMQNSEDDIYQADQLVYGFFDDDGLPDLFFTNGFGLNPGNFGPYKLFLNHTQTTANYVIIELTGRTANRDAIGAEVELLTIEGDFLGYRELGAGFNRSQSSHKLHFGLGQIDNELIARIKWPGIPDWDERTVIKNKINYIEQL